VRVHKLEFVPVPGSITEHCNIPAVPVNTNGDLLYKDLPAWISEVLGALELCNIQMSEIRQLMEESGDGK
jgi:hypothetical protein